MEKIIKFILALIFMLLPLLIKAAESDELYREGLSVRRTLTTVAQNKAISLFERARDCYDNPADKEKCDKQIRICVNTIERLGGTPVLNANGQNDSPASISYRPEQMPGENPVQAASEPVDTTVIVQDVPVIMEEEAVAEDTVVVDPVDSVEIVTEAATVAAPTIDQEFEFAAKNPEPQQLSLSAEGGWTFNGLQSWVKCDHKDDILTITVEPNTGKKRTCTFLISGSQGVFRITVIQREYKKFGIF